MLSRNLNSCLTKAVYPACKLCGEAWRGKSNYFGTNQRFLLNQRSFRSSSVYSCKREMGKWKKLIEDNTEVSIDHLTPEIPLRLITEKCSLYFSRAEENPFPSDPFWGFYWPGGQALTRYILDHSWVFSGRRVLELGSGCGASSIAARLAGADVVVANDVDHVALLATQLNAQLSGVDLTVSPTNLLTSPSSLHDTDFSAPASEDSRVPRIISDSEIILVGDMCYDKETAEAVWRLLSRLSSYVIILVSDPGRWAFASVPSPSSLRPLASYTLPESCQAQNHGFSSASVYLFSP